MVVAIEAMVESNSLPFMAYQMSLEFRKTPKCRGNAAIFIWLINILGKEQKIKPFVSNFKPSIRH